MIKQQENELEGLDYGIIRSNDMEPQDVYELYGVVEHQGGMNGGHYV